MFEFALLVAVIIIAKKAYMAIKHPGKREPRKDDHNLMNMSFKETMLSPMGTDTHRIIEDDD